MEREVVIGLEVHAQLRTDTKTFCRCPAAFGAPPNSLICPVCAGLPGVLPVVNRRAVELAVRAALVLGGTVHPRSIFARKNYFYPDLPKGYQISQYERPLATGGRLEFTVEGASRSVGIIRVHLEEDAGKSIHGARAGVTWVDLNRCGVPLIEIVSAPDLRSPREGYHYLQRLRQILLYAGVSDCDMEKGSLRCDANVSLRPRGEAALGTKTEVKNLNSFRFVERALEAEIARQNALLDRGEKIVQQTLLWDEDRGEVRPMRTKEEAHDYRYFPEPDLLPLVIDPPWVEEIRRTLPELPEARARRFVEAYGLPEYDARVLTATPDLADYFEEVARAHGDAKRASNWVMGEVLALCKDRGTEPEGLRRSLSPGALAELLDLIAAGAVSGTAAKEVLGEMVRTGKEARGLVEDQGLGQVSDAEALARHVEEVLAANPELVERYREGKRGLLGHFVGEVMRRTGGKANPQVVGDLLREWLEGTGA